VPSNDFVTGIRQIGVVSQGVLRLAKVVEVEQPRYPPDAGVRFLFGFDDPQSQKRLAALPQVSHIEAAGHAWT